MNHEGVGLQAACVGFGRAVEAVVEAIACGVGGKLRGSAQQLLAVAVAAGLAIAQLRANFQVALFSLFVNVFVECLCVCSRLFFFFLIVN